MGIDNVLWGGLVRPRMKSLVQPVGEIAQLATDWRLERIAIGAEADADNRA